MPYFLATWWFLRRKRLRARAHFAPLLAASPLAYRLWLRTEQHDSPKILANPSIIALVDRGETPGLGQADDRLLSTTLSSLAVQGIPALVVGSKQIPTLSDAIGHLPANDAVWLMPLFAGDVLAPGAATAYARAIATTQARIIYADDDLQDAAGQRRTPHFKPSWNAELFCHLDYLTGACILHMKADELRLASGKNWPERLVSAAAQVAQPGASGACPPVRVTQILHHRRERPQPKVPAVVPLKASLPSMTVVVPTRNRANLLRTCLEGLARTDYPDLEIIVIDNGSDDSATLAYLTALDPSRYRVLSRPGPFNFSSLNNRAAAEAKGTLLCLLNNDIEVLAPDWLQIMAQQALRDDVGAVGARLLYPDGRIQHAGVVLGIGGGAAHAHRLLHPQEDGYFRRHALPQFVSAVTGACLVVQRERFEAVGGLDEINFPVAFNDVDLCMRLNVRGWQSLYEPRATLVHHESASRGLDRDRVGATRLAGELAALQTAWNTGECVDPFHHPQLSRFSERFAVRL